MSASPFSDVCIRPARVDDLEAAFTLLHLSGLPTEGLQGHVESMLVADQRGIIVGTAALERYGKVALLRSVSVAESARGSGLGTGLTKEILTLAESTGVQRVFLLTETASDFFPRFGFRVVSRNEVPTPIASSIEFTTLCPESALAMEFSLV